jgi:hypothetical protein
MGVKMKPKNYVSYLLLFLVSILISLAYADTQSLPQCMGKGATDQTVACQNGPRFSMGDMQDANCFDNMDTSSCYNHRLATVGLTVVIAESGIKSAGLIANSNNDGPLSTLTGWQLSNNISNVSVMPNLYSFQFNVTTFWGNIGGWTTDPNSPYYRMKPSDTAEEALANWEYTTSYLETYTEDLGGPEFAADMQLQIAKMDGSQYSCRLGVGYGFFDQSSEKEAILSHLGSDTLNALLDAGEGVAGLSASVGISSFSLEPWALVWYFFRNDNDVTPIDNPANATSTGGDVTDSLDTASYFSSIQNSISGGQSQPIVVYCTENQTNHIIAYTLTPDPGKYIVTLTRNPSEDVSDGGNQHLSPTPSNNCMHGGINTCQQPLF